MQKIIIGREGTQPFDIKGMKVSRQHCELIINENVWTIQDKSTTYGTFIRDNKDGNFIPVSQEPIVIDPMTLICLGDETPEGCTFYAYSVLHPGKYAPIFTYLIEKEEEFDRKGDRLEKNAKMAKMVLFIANLIVLAVSFMPMDSEGRLMMLRIVPLLSTGLTAFYDPAKARKRVEICRKRFRHCPNPQCSEMLSDKAIRQGRCKCMKHL